MAFRRRFQSGTLGRSIRRFGRFPRPGFKRKQFAHLYSFGTIGYVASAPVLGELSLFSNSDVMTGGQIASGAMGPIRNVSFDVSAMLYLVPDLAAALVNYTAGPTYWHWAVYKQDVDESKSTMGEIMSTESCIRWGTIPVYFLSANGSAAIAANPSLVNQVRTKFRVSKLERDEEIVFAGAFSETTSFTAQLDDMQCEIVQRVRYEIP